MVSQKVVHGVKPITKLVENVFIFLQNFLGFYSDSSIHWTNVSLFLRILIINMIESINQVFVLPGFLSLSFPVYFLIYSIITWPLNNLIQDIFQDIFQVYLSTVHTFASLSALRKNATQLSLNQFICETGCRVGNAC